MDKINDIKTVLYQINELLKLGSNVIYLQGMIDYICDGVDSNDANMSNHIYRAANKANSDALLQHG